MRCYLVKSAKIVASVELPNLSPDEAIETARKMFETSSYDGVEVWSPTRRIYRQGRIAKPKTTKPSRRPRLIAVRLAAA